VTEQTASTLLPATLAATTLKAAVCLAATGAAAGIASTQVITLMEGVMQTMFVNKLKLTTAVLLGLTLIAGTGTFGYGGLTRQVGDGKQDAESSQADERKAPLQARTRKDEAPPVRKLTAEERRIQQAQREAYREQWKARIEEYLDGKTTVDVVCEASRFLGQAERLLSRTIAEEVAACEAQLQRDREIEHIARERFNAGKGNAAELSQARGQLQLAESNLSEVRKPGPRMSRLLRERRDTAKTEWDLRLAEFKTGPGHDTGVALLCESSQRWLHAEREERGGPDEQTAAWEAHVRRMKEVEDLVAARFKIGTTPAAEVELARYYRLDAEIGLERLTR
jgi:hypothetical protein